jgi:mono/diheme cytochrome c family protein
MKRIALVLVTLAAIVALAGAAMVHGGFYDISATDQHLAPTYWALDRGMRSSVKLRARDLAVPPLDDPQQVARGLAAYRDHCVQCHGAPGVPPEPFALGMTPAPAALAYTAREWPPADLFWVIKHGIKMTGMPAWTFRMSDEEIWAIVAFMRIMPSMSVVEYRQRESPQRLPHEAAATAAPDAERGKRALQQYACVTCHRIPGVVGPNAPVGPPLEGMAERAVIAGVLPNTSGNLVRWLRDPQAVKPDSAMPDLGVSPRDARDIAAYLRTLD